MTNTERKFRIIKPTAIQKTFGSTKLGWHYTVVSEADIKCYWHKNGEAKDKLVRTIKIGSIISLDEKIFLEWEGLRTDHFTQEITPAENTLKKMFSILNTNFLDGYILNYKKFYKVDGKDDWLKNNICAEQYEISESANEGGYNIDSECCEICKKADKVPDEEKFYYEYGYYYSEDDTDPEIYLSEEEYDILKSLEEENG